MKKGKLFAALFVAAYLAATPVYAYAAVTGPASDPALIGGETETVETRPLYEMTDNARAIAKVIAAKNPRLHAEYDGSITEICSDQKQFWRDILPAVQSYLRETSIKHYSWRYASNGGYECALPADVLMDSVQQQREADDWFRKNTPNIIHNGMTKQECIDLVYHYIRNNYPYDGEHAGDLQSAIEAINRGAAVCASHAKLFRGFLEIIPFDANGLVNWALIDDPNADHIQVTLMGAEDLAHVWDAIWDGTTWIHYDVTNNQYGVDAAAIVRMWHGKTDEAGWAEQ